MDPHPFRHFPVSAGRGLELGAWERCAGTGGTAVLVCPGLGADPESQPELLHSAADARLLGWAPRRAAREWGVHVADALAVLDAAGVRCCAVVGWSAGAAVAAELARREPQRVRGLLLLGAEPGSALLRSLGMPAAVARLAALGAGSAPDPAPLLRALLAEQALPEAVRGPLRWDWRWTLSTALALAADPPPAADRLDCPVTLLTGTLDPGTAAARRVAALPQARLRIVPATHFLPWEATGAVAGELALLLRRMTAVEFARGGLEPPAPPAAQRPLRAVRIRTPGKPFPYPPPGHPSAG